MQLKSIQLIKLLQDLNQNLNVISLALLALLIRLFALLASLIKLESQKSTFTKTNAMMYVQVALIQIPILFAKNVQKNA